MMETLATTAHTTHQFSVMLKKYANLILELGVHLRRGEYLLVSALTVQRDFAIVIAQEAYRRGASFVNIIFQDEKLQRAQLEFAEEKSLSFVSQSMIKAYEEVLDQKGAFVSLSGREDLESFKGIKPERHSKALLARIGQLEFFYKKIQTHAIKWCVAAASTPGRARYMFPALPQAEAEQALWDRIFTICKINEADALAAWKKHAQILENRKSRLNEWKIRELFFSSPTAQLSVGLDPRALWKGGISQTLGGEYFLPNLPTEEVFTAPDFHRVNGYFAATRPLTYKNIYIEELSLSFKDGELVKLEGSSGVDELESIVKTDVSHRRLGEVALVDSSSAVAQSGMVFHDLLYDENASSHVALGSAYNECFDGIREVGEAERERAGFNSSPLHIDIMLGSPACSVTAVCQDNSRKTVIENGFFTFV